MRASYERAIWWIVENDDNGWIEDEEPLMSVAAELVSDIFGKTKEQVYTDLCNYIIKNKEDTQ